MRTVKGDRCRYLCVHHLSRGIGYCVFSFVGSVSIVSLKYVKAFSTLAVENHKIPKHVSSTNSILLVEEPKAQRTRRIIIEDIFCRALEGEAPKVLFVISFCIPYVDASIFSQSGKGIFLVITVLHPHHVDHTSFPCLNFCWIDATNTFLGNIRHRIEWQDRAVWIFFLSRQLRYALLQKSTFVSCYKPHFLFRLKFETLSLLYSKAVGCVLG
mmetsp:Transcript_18817/g.30335  ORF Transcript_18817/g.30335 Transcript_18817/m.30335 type:complete len:213 (-) Transcript_18817:11-649(-)